jgi:hypothetical protein
VGSAEDSTPRPADFRASIHAYVDRDLTFAHLEDGYELRYEDTPLGWVDDPRHERVAIAVTRDGAWRFTRTRGGGVEVSEPREDAPVIARYGSKLLPGGTIELPEGLRLRLRPPILGETWKVRRGPREQILELTPDRSRPWRARLSSASRDIHQLPLLTVLAFHAVVSEIDSPDGGPANTAPGFGL